MIEVMFKNDAVLRSDLGKGECFTYGGMARYVSVVRHSSTGKPVSWDLKVDRWTLHTPTHDCLVRIVQAYLEVT